MLVAKNHQKIRSKCLVYEFCFTDIFNDINQGYRAAILKNNSLWLLQFYMAVAAYCYYEKVRKMMRSTSLNKLSAVLSVFLPYFSNYSQFAKRLKTLT